METFGSVSTLADLTGGSLTFVLDLRAVLGRFLLLLDSLSLSSLLLLLLLKLDTDRRRFLGPLDFIPGSLPFFAATASPTIIATAAIPAIVAPAIKATSRQNVLVLSTSDEQNIILIELKLYRE